jgi:hypothetical protein
VLVTEQLHVVGSSDGPRPVFTGVPPAHDHEAGGTPAVRT